MVKVRYTEGFMNFIKNEEVKNTHLFDIQSLYEIYINCICCCESFIDNEIPKEDLIVRM